MKTKVGTEMTKEQEAYPVPVQHTTVTFPQQVEQPDHAGATCWYVCGILASIFCCFPCGIIGMVHAMISKHEAERGNIRSHKQRLHQAKCWTSWSIALGIVFTILLILWGVFAYRHFGGMDMSFEDDLKDMERDSYSDDWSGKGWEGKDMDEGGDFEWERPTGRDDDYGDRHGDWGRGGDEH